LDESGCWLSARQPNLRRWAIALSTARININKSRTAQTQNLK